MSTTTGSRESVGSATEGLSKVEILSLCALELGGLRDDLEKAGLARPRPPKRPALRLVRDGEGD
jgi:hypothetical protein